MAIAQPEQPDVAHDRITVRYSSTRGEIWKWYKVRWRTHLWRYWAIAGGIAFCVTLWNEGLPTTLNTVLVALLTTTALLLFFIAFPQLSFKPQERTLSIAQDGIASSIGKKRGSRAWSEIGTISDTPEFIVFVVAKTGNAFLVPNRAFLSDADRVRFLRSAQSWHQIAKSETP